MASLFGALSTAVPLSYVIQALNSVMAALQGGVIDLTVSQAWTALPFGAGWTDYGAPWSPCGYWKDALGIVHLQGLVTTNSTSSAFGTTIATLPLGYRPSLNQIFAQASYNPNYGALRIDVNTAGQVSPQALLAGSAWTPSATADSVWLSLDGITFKAA